MAKRIRRTPEQLVADLKAKIASIKARAERRRAKANPAVRHTLGAIKAIDKAAAATADGTMRAALQEARATLVACTAINGVVVPTCAAWAEKTTVRQKQCTREGAL